jgi:hypothetical protein
MQSRDTPSSVVGVEQANGRRRRSPLAWSGWLVGLTVIGASALAGQTREHLSYRADEPEGRLLAYYGAAMALSSLGSSAPAGRWMLGIEAGWIPALSEVQRRPGIDKPETTNLASILPRPRLSIRTPVATLEASWVPPIRVGDARAHLLAVAASRSLGTWRGISVAPRLSVVGGRVEGAITCNASTMAGRGAALATYYAAVCHGRDSRDWFEPRLLAGELEASRPMRRAGSRAWVAAGARLDRSRFDIGVRHSDGRRDPDHPVLALRATRPQVAAGVRWPMMPRLSGAIEGVYAPRSLATLRTLLSIDGAMP